MKKFAGVVVLYNPIKDNLDIINNYINSIDKLYIIDNSNVKCKNHEILNNSKVEYIWNRENLGIAKALNIGINKAIDDGFLWVLTMDQDSKITDNIVIGMEKYIDSNNMSKIGIVSPYHDILTFESKNKCDVEELLETMTSGNFVNTKIFKKVKGFKEWLFIDGVDIEYGLNLNKHGYKVIRLNNLVMKHHLGDAKEYGFLGKKVICSNHSSIRRYYMIRNNLYIYDMYNNVYPEYCKKLIDVQKGQLKRVIVFEKNKIDKIKMMYKGYKDYKKGIKGKLILK